MIEASGLRRQFGQTVAVDGVSLSVPDGALLALLGPNGAGKTTTVRMLAGLLTPTAGQAVVAGHDVRTDPAAVRARVGLVTDTPGLHDQMAPAPYLDFFGQIYGLDAVTRRQRIDELLGLFDLRPVAHTRMAGFSRGMQQKVALARALLHDPEVVFLDEPTAGLDPLSARVVRDLIVGLKHAHRAIVLCTHDLDEAERLADRVSILRHGQIVASDTPAALRAAASRESVVQIVFNRPCPEAVAIASSIEQVHGATFGPAADQPLSLSFRTLDPRATNPQLISRLSGAGAGIVSVTCATASLEDVYAAALGHVVEASRSDGAGSPELAQPLAGVPR